MYREIEENWGDLDRRDLSFSNIWQLKLLILDGMTALTLCDIPCTLKVLHWIYCPMKTLPFADQRYELVEIDLSYSIIVQLWDGKKFLKDLKHLNLSGCYKLEQTPDLSEVPNLKTLNLEECRELNHIHPTLAHHKSLVELILRGCSSLETLADKLEMSSLERLNLCSCYRLRRLPEFGECMKQLTILTLRFTDIKELPSTLGNLVGLSKLDLAALESIVLPVSLGCFVGLKKLDLSGCNELSCVPYSSHGLESLTVWDSSDNSNIVGLLSSLSLLTSLSSLKLWVSFPTSKEYDLGHLASLSDLDLSCNSFQDFLEVLPELPSSLRELRAEDCYSLDASSVNDVISKACCVFAESASKDCEDILQVLIHGKEIPAWFEHQEQDNAVSLSFPHNGTSTETLALALCFLFEDETFSNEQPSMICNGKEFISKSLLKVSSCICSENLFIVCLNGCYFSNLLSQHNRFQMLFPNIEVQRCGARWVCKQDTQDFKK
ncbi:hypothetical protein S245_013865 [Arachis hypogaea]